jgi:oligosaccharide repeat unit polymerase
MKWGIYVVLAVFAILLGVFQYYESTVGITHWFVFLTSWVLIFRVASCLSRDTLSPIWLIAAYLWMCFFVRPLYVLLSGKSIYLFGVNAVPVEAHLLLLSSFFVSFVFLSFCVGYFLSTQILSVDAIRQLYKIDISVNKNMIDQVAVVILGVATVAFIYIVVQLGGVGDVLGKQAGIGYLIPRHSTAVKIAWIAFNVYFFGVALLLIAGKPMRLIYLVSFFGMMMCLIMGRRYALFGVIMPLVMHQHYYLRRFNVKETLGLGAAVFIVFFGVVAYRIINAPHSSFVTIWGVFSSAEYFVWDMNMSILTHYGDTQPYRLGMDFLPYWFRALFGIDEFFTSYPSIDSALVSMYFHGFRVGIPAGMQGTLFMNFGWFGVFIGMAAWGALTHICYEYILTNKDNKFVMLLIYPVILLTFFHWLRVGDFWLGFSTQIRFVVVAILLVLLSSNFRIVRKD